MQGIVRGISFYSLSLPLLFLLSLPCSSHNLSPFLAPFSPPNPPAILPLSDPIFSFPAFPPLTVGLPAMAWGIPGDLGAVSKKDGRSSAVMWYQSTFWSPVWRLPTLSGNLSSRKIWPCCTVAARLSQVLRWLQNQAWTVIWWPLLQVWPNPVAWLLLLAGKPVQKPVAWWILPGQVGPSFKMATKLLSKTPHHRHKSLPF